MNQQQFLEKLKAEPFEPFVVVTNSGDRYEVRHPEFAKVAPRHVYVFRPSDSDSPHRVQGAYIIGLRNISALEPMPNEAA
jgi:hypothetical protein